MKDISARAIAERAGVSVGTIYAYFGNLTELMQSLWKQPVSRFLAELEALAQKLNDPLEKLEAILHAYANFSSEQRSVYRGAFLHVRPESHEKPEAVALKEDRLFALICNTIVEGQTRGMFKSGDPDKLTQTIWAGVHGAIALPINIDRLALDTSEEPVQLMIAAMLEWLRSGC